MITNKTLGRATCPACGELNQDVRLSDKNNKLYIYCEGGCRTWFNTARSEAYKKQLLAGQNVNDGKIFIKSIINGVKDNEKQDTRTTEAGARPILHPAATRTNRTDGVAAGTATGTTAGQPRVEFVGRTANSDTNASGNERRGFLAWLADDDSDD